MIHRLAIPLIAIIVLVIVIWAYLGNSSNTLRNERQDTMAATETATLPLIDANAPAKTETATFALG